MLAIGVVAGLVASVGAAVLLARRCYLSVLVKGQSMAPAFQDGDRVLVRRLRKSPVRIGQVVVLRRPSPAGGGQADKSQLLLKRAVAIAGDPVPAQAQPAIPADAVVVPGGAVVVLGDNPASEDSKQWGFVSTDNLVGVVVGHRRSLRR